MNSVVGKQIHIILKLKTQTENSSSNLRNKEVLKDKREHLKDICIKNSYAKKELLVDAIVHPGDYIKIKNEESAKVRQPEESTAE